MTPTLLLATLLSAPPAAPPATDAPAATFTIDTSRCPEMADYGTKVKALAEKWYPRIAAMLPSEGFTPPTTVTFVFDPEYQGVAAASRNRIVCSVKYFKAHPDDLGAFVHELAHVVQAYRRRVPGWLIEGIADHVRFFGYEPLDQRPRRTLTRPGSTTATARRPRSWNGHHKSTTKT